MPKFIQYRGQRRLTNGAVWLGIIAVICLAVGLLDGPPNALVFAFGLICTVVGYNLLQTPPVKVDFDADGFRIEGREEIPYSEVISLSANGIPHSDVSKVSWNQVEIGHGNNTLILPKKGNVSASEIFSFLLPKLSTGPSRPDLLPAVLQEFYAEQVDLFGEEKVWAFGGLQQKSRQVARTAMPIRLGLGALIFSITTLIAYFAFGKESGAVVITSVIMMIFGGLVLLVGRLGSGSSLSKYFRHPLGIVIAPQGIALAQGGVQGQQSWESIGEVSVVTRGQPKGLGMKFPGTTLLIVDVYNCAIQEIEAKIRQYKGKP